MGVTGLKKRRGIAINTNCLSGGTLEDPERGRKRTSIVAVLSSSSVRARIRRKRGGKKGKQRHRLCCRAARYKTWGRGRGEEPPSLHSSSRTEREERKHQPFHRGRAESLSKKRDGGKETSCPAATSIFTLCPEDEEKKGGIVSPSALTGGLKVGGGRQQPSLLLRHGEGGGKKKKAKGEGVRSRLALHRDQLACWGEGGKGEEDSIHQWYRKRKRGEKLGHFPAA